MNRVLQFDWNTLLLCGYNVKGVAVNGKYKFEMIGGVSIHEDAALKEVIKYGIVKKGINIL